MNRDEKATTIEEIAAQIEAAEAIFAVDYRGISVPQASELRGKLRESDASFRIVKNRLTKLAADRAGEERLAALLKGPTALTFVRGDTAAAAKAITTFNKEHDVLTYKGGFMDGTDLDEDRFESIARLPTRDVLNGQFAGVVASPITGLVRGLGSMIQGLALQLGQIAEQGLVTGEAPTPEAAGPASDEGSSSSQAAGEDSSSESPAAEAEGTDAGTPAEGDGEGGESPDSPEENGEGGASDAPVEKDSAGSSAESEPPPEPSQAEGDEGDAEPAGDETSKEETSDTDEEKEE